MIINKRLLLDYFVLALFVAISGVPLFHSKLLTIFEFSILFYLFLLRKKRFNGIFLLFFILLIVVTFLQAFKFQFFPIVTNFGFLIMVFSAYLMVKILDNKFISYYINIIYYTAIISLMFFIPFTVFPSLALFFYNNITPIFDSLDSSQHSLVIYNITYKEGYLKNSGPFWEPGAFAGYLIIAYIFNFLRESAKITKKNIVLLITIVTTLSTTAYLTLFIFFFFIYFKKIKNVIFKVSMIIIMILVGIYAYNSFDFLGEKIEKQIKMAQTMGIQKSDNSQRFLTILRDIEDFKGHEFIGRGGHDETRYDLAPADNFIIRTVGLTDILVRVGIIVYIIMFFYIYRSICIYLEYIEKRKQVYCFGIFIAILITLMSEVYFNFPMYWSLLFLQFVYKQKMK